MAPDDLDAWDDLLSREEVLAGLPARRAATLLYAIETRVAHLVARSRRATELYVTEEALAERDLAFVEALATGGEPPIRPTIQDLERHADQWAPLVPRNPRLQAALAHLLGQRYRFTAVEIDGVRRVLGLDEPAVGAAYARQYGAPLETIFASRTGPVERLRWLVARLRGKVDELSPFWTSYSLTLTETVGATILALPIALAGIGPLPGVVILVVLGLVNVLTLAYFAEAVARSGTVRATDAYLGRMVSDYLGSMGSAVLSLTLFALCLLALAAFYVGFGTVLEGASGVPAPVWVVVLFLLGLYYLRRESLDATVTSALVVGAVNIVLLIAISVLALGHLDLVNLRYADIPFVGGRGLDAAVLGLVFGVVLASYFGHTSAGLCGRLVLRRDPSGRSLVRGCVAAHLTTIALYCFFVVAVNGAVDPQILAAESGTALEPLAELVGPSVRVLGTIFAVLALGMVSIQFSLAAFNLARERLPSSHRPVHMRLRRRETLRFVDRGPRDLHVALTYLGSNGDGPRFRTDVQVDGTLRSIETVAPPHWDVLTTNGVAPLLVDAQADRRVRLQVATLRATSSEVEIRVTSSLRVVPGTVLDSSGLDLGGVVTAGDDEAAVAGWLAREGSATAAEIGAGVGLTEEATLAALDGLVMRGVAAVEPSGDGVRHTLHVAPRRPRRLPDRIWDALDADDRETEPTDATTASAWRTRLGRVVFGRRGRFVLAAAPVAGVFAATQVMLTTDAGSFAALLAVLGTITVALLAGIFPVLLLASSRRKGEHDVAVLPRWVTHPVLGGAVYVLFLAALLLHGLIIWDDPLWRLGALLVAVVTVVMTVLLAVQRAFARRMNLEVWEEAAEPDQIRAGYRATIGSDPLSGEILVEGPHGQRRVTNSDGDLPPLAAMRRITFRPAAPTARAPRELKVWVHASTAGIDRDDVPGTVTITAADEEYVYDLLLSGGVVTRPLDGSAIEVDVDLTTGPQGSGR